MESLRPFLKHCLTLEEFEAYFGAPLEALCGAEFGAECAHWTIFFDSYQDGDEFWDFEHGNESGIALLRQGKIIAHIAVHEQ